MAKEKKPEGKAHEEKKGAGKKKLHLHEIRTTQAADGSLVHHHTYKDSADSPHTHPEREAMATSQSPEEAGQHVEEQFGMNGMGGGEEEGEPGQGEGEEEEPAGAE